MHVIFKPSPSVTHKYRVMLPNKRAIDFGTKDAPDYTDHRNSRLMRAHLIRRGAIIPRKIRDQEDWDDYFRADYWERWLLWTYPNVEHAKLFMTMRKGILFMPTLESLF
jgi:hypothetical protein